VSTLACPGRRLASVHFRAISSRCDRRIVNGVTSVATSRNTPRPSRCPEHREAAALHIIQPQPAPSQLRFQCAILLAKERDHIMLLALEPSEQRDKEHL
jgi:hypothetical protein